MQPIQKMNLRRIEREDIPLLWKWSLNDELAFFNAFTSNKSKAEFSKEYESRIGSTNIMDYIILQGDEEKPIGFCGLKEINWVDRHSEIFISICDEKARKNGLATIAILMLTKIAFYELNLNKIYAKVASHNKRIMSLMQDWGFTKEGILREMHYRNNQYYDLLVYGVLKSEATDLLSTTITKVSKHLFPGCTDETIEQIKQAINQIMGSESSPGEKQATTYAISQ